MEYITEGEGESRDGSYQISAFTLHLHKALKGGEPCPPLPHLHLLPCQAGKLSFGMKASDHLSFSFLHFQSGPPLGARQVLETEGKGENAGGHGSAHATMPSPADYTPSPM